MKKILTKTVAAVFACAVLILLSGCDYALFDPKGTVALGIRNTMFITVGLMLLVVVPTIILGAWMPYRSRASRKNADYDPDWDHSNKIEMIVWGIPITIVIILATITYFTSYSLDPRQEIVSDKKPLTIQVVALDWKWLFIYPEQEIAVINELYLPNEHPVQFLITSNSTMNSFFIPRLAGQLYAMGGMENRLNIMASEKGVYRGMSSNYSGYGFSGMRFKAHVTSEQDFASWVAEVKKSTQVLDDARFDNLQLQTRDHPIEYYSEVNPLLFKKIIEKFTGVQNGSQR